MASCTPKHIACGWYSPTNGSPPFVAGNESCILQSFSESRARLAAGGTFFRSVNFGSYANNIQISSTWQVLNAGSPVTYSDYDVGIHDLFDVARVELIITRPDGLLEIYHADQSYVGSPLYWSTNAIPALRELIGSGVLLTCPDEGSPLCGSPLEGSPVCGSPLEGCVTSPLVTESIVSMPTGDVGSITNDDHLSEFTNTNLTGGSYGNPTLTNIRTGPTLSMIFISGSENLITGKTISGNFGVRYWNGACWKLDDLTNPDCAGESPVCGTGPETGCS